MRKLMMFMKQARMEMGGHGMPGMGPGRGMPPFEMPDGAKKPAHQADGCGGHRQPEAPGPQGCHRPEGCHDPHGHGRRRPPLSREHLLIIIGKHPEGIRQKMIAEQVGINQSSTSELINKLESDGYLERRVDPNDKRATLLFLTEKGAARAAEVEDERKEMFNGLFARLTDEEKQSLSDLLDKLLGQGAEEV